MKSLLLAAALQANPEPADPYFLLELGGEASPGLRSPYVTLEGSYARRWLRAGAEEGFWLRSAFSLGVPVGVGYDRGFFVSALTVEPRVGLLQFDDDTALARGETGGIHLELLPRLTLGVRLPASTAVRGRLAIDAGSGPQLTLLRFALKGSGTPPPADVHLFAFAGLHGGVEF